MVGSILCAAALFVAATGDDAHPGTLAQPFATLQRAALEARRGDTVWVRGGMYFLHEPLTIGPQQSGVTFAAYRDENPIISGGRRITGWKLVPGGPLWSAELPADWSFREMWVNGARRTRARNPNDGFLKITGLPDAGKEESWHKDGQQRFEFAAGDIRVWDNLADVEVVVLHCWVDVRLPVASVDETNRIVSFTVKSRRRLVEGGEPARYYVENAFELLDAPGEWYLNRRTRTLYYWPMPGEDMKTVEVIAPVLPALLRVSGNRVTFRGLTFAYAEWQPPGDDAGDYQAAVQVPAAVRVEKAGRCRFERCVFTHLGTYGLELGRACDGNVVTGCEFSDLGAGGVKIGETQNRAEFSEQTFGNEVSDCHIQGGGRLYHQAVGVWIGQSYGNRIARNHIHDFFYTGISVGWTWGYGKSLAHHNVIEGNAVHDIGQGLLSDMAGIYTLGPQPGTVIRGNVFHDIAAYAYGGWGIYFDEGSTGIVAERNIVYRTTHGGFHQHYGKENIVRNNIFAFGRSFQLQRSRPEAHRSFTFTNNIVYGDSDPFLSGDWSKGQAVFDHNLYWRIGGGLLRFGQYSWKEWQARGYDVHSRVADPMFVAPERGDFRLQRGSPARAHDYVVTEKLLPWDTGYMKTILPIMILALAAGCSTAPKTTLRFYEQTAESMPDSMSKTVDVPRANLRITINSSPVLSELDMESAEITQTSGGSAVLVRFDPHGAIKLDEMMMRGRGQYMVAMINDRPVAAVRMGQRIPHGQLLLEGDFTDDEARKMVEDLNKFIRQHKPL